MKVLTHSQFVDILAESKGVLIVGIEALIDSRAKKTGNPFGPIYKKIRTVGFVGVDYQKAVEREAGRQGENANEFRAEKLPWGKWAIVNKLIVHDGYYLRTQTTPGQRRKQAAKVLFYCDENGNKLSKEQVKPFLPVARESAKQQDEGNLIETIWVRTYKLDRIERLRVNGVTYKLKIN